MKEFKSMSMKKVAIVCMLSLLTSCLDPKPAIDIAKTNNSQFHVELLFEVDGCKIYRFEDGDYRYKYFTTCKGSVNWTESCGKNCISNESIETK